MKKQEAESLSNDIIAGCKKEGLNFTYRLEPLPELYRFVNNPDVILEDEEYAMVILKDNQVIYTPPQRFRDGVTPPYFHIALPQWKCELAFAKKYNFDPMSMLTSNICLYIKHFNH